MNNLRGLLCFGVPILMSWACGDARRHEVSHDESEEHRRDARAEWSSGEQLYQRCVSCHQLNGQGTPGVFPPLAGSEYATAANVAVPIRVVINGLSGPITVKGGEYTGVMPAYGVGVEMTDQEVADVLTYVRSSWGNTAGAVTAADVARERTAKRDTRGATTAEELRRLMRP
jgi:mono/diheme cytochrome c family protein